MEKSIFQQVQDRRNIYIYIYCIRTIRRTTSNRRTLPVSYWYYGTQVFLVLGPGVGVWAALTFFGCTARL